ncbi:MAG TPA: metalloregulator ArsR/SmtB family transcription factor [Spirochaetia bacterium]|nr:metalloregulator ArsR/SmtB family transcription factor [Spirochaetia bacterium]
MANIQKTMEKNKVDRAIRPTSRSVAPALAPLRPSTAAAIPRIARTLKVCGHPVRLKLLRAIESSEPCVTDLWHCVGEPQPVVSQHLAVLKREKIVASRIQGNRRIYTVTDSWVRDLISRLP